MDPVTGLLILALVIIAIVLAVAITLGVLVYRGALTLANRSKPRIEYAKRRALKMRAESSSGPVADILKQRVALQESLESTGRSLGVAQATGQYTGNLGSIFTTLQQAGAVMEHQLVVAQQEPDPAVQALYAKTLGVQVEQINQTARGVRNALASAAAPAGDVDMKDLTRTLEIEAAMLRNWSKTYTDLGKD
jgi:hypothetical protein